MGPDHRQEAATEQAAEAAKETQAEAGQPETAMSQRLLDLLHGDVAAAREACDRLQRRRHDPDREGAGGWPPGPPPHPRPA